MKIFILLHVGICYNKMTNICMMKPRDRHGKAFIFEFKVIDPDEDERTLEDTLANAHLQIEEKQYEAELIAEGFLPRTDL